MLSTAQVARHLQVKTETVYAYVSRGILHPVKVPGERGSFFAEDEVRALTRPTGVRRARRAPGLSDDITTAITQVTDERLTHRGHDVVALAQGSYEEACAVLWQCEIPTGAFWVPDSTAVAIRRAVAALPAGAGPLDVMVTAVQVVQMLDPGRDDRAPAAVRQAGTRSIAAAVVGLGGPDEGDLATRVATLLRGRPVRRGSRLHTLIRTALVLLADHDMALSTTAARVCASVRADPYAVLTTALCTLRSPQHGRASIAATALLADAMGDPQGVLASVLAGTRLAHGFGHVVLTERDPRAECLLALLEGRMPARLSRAVDLLWDELWQRRGLFPNIDLALAALIISEGLDHSAGETIFALARMAGWTAHAMEEYEAEPLRFRLRGVYTGPRSADGRSGPGVDIDPAT
ncbi:citrate/2-methylcitrate synthase [Propionibacteriaceae bacterium Y1685]